jgi:hypothetical protein
MTQASEARDRRLYRRKEETLFTVMTRILRCSRQLPDSSERQSPPVAEMEPKVATDRDAPQRTRTVTRLDVDNFA